MSLDKMVFETFCYTKFTVTGPLGDCLLRCFLSTLSSPLVRFGLRTTLSVPHSSSLYKYSCTFGDRPLRVFNDSSVSSL